MACKHLGHKVAHALTDLAIGDVPVDNIHHRMRRIRKVMEYDFRGRALHPSQGICKPNPGRKFRSNRSCGHTAPLSYKNFYLFIVRKLPAFGIVPESFILSLRIQLENDLLLSFFLRRIFSTYFSGSEIYDERNT